MNIKSDTRGITFIELIIAISLLVGVLFSAYFFLSFSTKSFNNTEAEFDAGFDARMALISMENDIRKAQSVTIVDVKHSAVTVAADGMAIDVYTDVGSDGTLQLVQYKLDGTDLKRGVADMEYLPSTWTIIANNIKNASSPAIPVFSQDGKMIKIKLIIYDDKEYLINDPIEVKTSITVRSKGAMN